MEIHHFFLWMKNHQMTQSSHCGTSPDDHPTGDFPTGSPGS